MSLHKLNLVTRTSTARMRNLAERLRDNSLPLAAWRDRMADEIKLVQSASALSAHARLKNLPADLPDTITDIVDRQLEYLDNFAGQIASGEQALDGTLANRAAMYARAGRGTYQNLQRDTKAERGWKWEMRVLGEADAHCPTCLEAAGYWAPIGTLPPIGSLACITNCLCRFVYSSSPNAPEADPLFSRHATRRIPLPKARGRGVAAFGGVGSGIHGHTTDRPAPSSLATPEQSGSAWAKLTRAGLTVEHAVAARFNHLPKAIRLPVAAIFKTGFVTYIAAQRAAKAVAFQKGGAAHADHVARTLAALDLVGAKTGPLAMGAVFGPAAAAATYWAPLASLSYLAYSTARNPVHTYNAAKKAIHGVRGAIKILKNPLGNVGFGGEGSGVRGHTTSLLEGPGRPAATAPAIPLPKTRIQKTALPTGKKTAPRVPMEKLSEKAQRAKDNHHMVDKVIQRYAEERNEPAFAKKMGGVSFPDNEEFDVAVPGPGGAVQHGIELKTMVDNKSSKITMKKSAMLRKAKWEKDNGATFHTVVYDDQKVFNARGPGKHDVSKRQIYYKRGAGSFRVGAMHPVKNHAELKRLMGTANDDLPDAARAPGSWKAIQAVARGKK